MEADKTNDDSATINAILLEYLHWAGLEDTEKVFNSECESRGFAISQDGLESRCTSRASTIGNTPEDFADDLLSHFDSGQGAKFFQIWRQVRECHKQQPSLEVLTVEFYLHVYFATLPLRHGHQEDHPAAMKVFRQFLESCPSTVGAVQELLPFYALPYVPDPKEHPTFTQVFQDAWVQDLRSRMCAWLGRRQKTLQLPAIFSYLRRYRQHSSSVGATLMAQESAASAVRSQRTLRRRLQRLNDDYQKLIGVSWELTQALEAAVRGERVDLEATLAACTHRYPELFSLCLTADTSAGPASILLESMQRYEKRPGAATHLSALDFERVRSDLGTAPDTHVLLLLQALRHRITRVTSGSVRHAVVTSYVRGDVLGVRNGARSWSRICAALTHPNHQLLAQTAARLINALTAFNAGRSYLASDEVSRVLLSTLKVNQPDPAATDMALAALQKLSIRDEVQSALIRDGCVEWLVEILGKARTLPPYTQEYAAALLMNLTLRSAGRDRCIPLGPALLPALTQLLATVPAHVIPYVTGALYSLLSHPTLRQDAFDLGLDTTLRRLSQGGSKEQRRQLEYIIGEIQRDPPSSPPPSPDPMLDLEEDPEWLEEELDVDDPVKPPPHAPTGEELLSWRYTLHSDERSFDGVRPMDSTLQQPRSAPVAPWAPLPSLTIPRPSTDSIINSQQKQQPGRESRNHWEYPQELEEGRESHYPGRSSSIVNQNAPSGTAWGQKDDSNERKSEEYQTSTGDIWIRGEEETQNWALSLQSGSQTPRLRSLRGSTVPSSDQHSIIERDYRSDLETGASTADNEEFSRKESQSRRSSVHRRGSITPRKVRNLHQDNRPVTTDDASYHDFENYKAPIRKSPSSPPMTAPATYEGTYTPQRRSSYTISTDRQQISLDDHSVLVNPDNASLSERITTKLSYSSDDGCNTRRRNSVASLSNERNSTEDSKIDENAFPEIKEISQQDNENRDDNWKRVQKSVLDASKDRQTSVDEDKIEDGETNNTSERDPLNTTNYTSPDLQRKNSKTPTIDLEASQLVQEIVGQSREIPAATCGPDDDPLLRSLPVRKVSEYVVAFSSRPKLNRTPPSSAAGAGDSGHRRQYPSEGDINSENSPRHVLPPISSTNHTYTSAKS